MKARLIGMFPNAWVIALFTMCSIESGVLAWNHNPIAFFCPVIYGLLVRFYNGED